jgi:MFS family permease
VSYLREFSVSWQAFAAACIGMTAGTVSIYMNNIFSPHLIGAFGWSKSEFALIGLTVIVSVICLPIVGRLTDRYGMKSVALVGVIGLPAIFLGLAIQPGSFTVFFALSVLQMLVISSLAGIVVYGRLIVRGFVRARGLALGLASCAAPLATVVFTPLLSAFIDAYGWRAGYGVMAVFAAVLGATALLIIPQSYQDRDPVHASSPSPVGDYKALLGNRAFLTIFAGLLLCNLHFTMQTTQLKLVLTENGIASAAGSAMISIFALGVVIGRLMCGLALDRFPASHVATACFLVPSLGLATLSSGTPDILLAGFAVASLGFSVGAESDIAAFLAAKYFPANFFSSVLGLFTCAMAASAVTGALLLSWTVEISGSYALFLRITFATMFFGSLSFQLLRQPEGVPILAD